MSRSKEQEHEHYIKNKEKIKLRVHLWSILNRKKTREAQARYRKRHPDRIIAQRKKQKSKPDFKIKVRAYYQKNKERISATSWKTKLRIRYGITTDDYEVMKIKQQNKCAICKEVKPLSIDHCHKSGKVRALLCTGCNIGLGAFNDDVVLLSNAIGYITSPTHQTQ